MSIKEKKTSKGNSYAILKFSDLSKVFDIFLFSEILDKNRKNLFGTIDTWLLWKLTEGKSFLLTVIRDVENKDNRFKRLNVRKVINLNEIAKKNYNDVFIEIDTAENLNKLYENIKEKGDAKIKISIQEQDKNYLFELKEKRKFNYEMLKHLNKERYIKKITV